MKPLLAPRWYKKVRFCLCHQGGITVGLTDFQTPTAKADILTSWEKVNEIGIDYQMGLITEDERHSQVIDIWNEATEKITED